MSTTTIDMAGLDGMDTSSWPSISSMTLTRGSRGRCCFPETQGWDDAVRIWNGMVTKAPALVVQPASARRRRRRRRGSRASTGCSSAIKGGGHNIAGTADRRARPDARHVADARRHRRPRAKLAHVGPGCRLQDVDRATQEHGLATRARLHLRGRRRRADARRRPRLSDAPLRLDRRQPRGGRDRDRRRRDPHAPAATRTPTCSGRCGAAAATSASSRGSRSACTRSARPSTAA